MWGQVRMTEGRMLGQESETQHLVLALPATDFETVVSLKLSRPTLPHLYDEEIGLGNL